MGVLDEPAIVFLSFLRSCKGRADEPAKAASEQDVVYTKAGTDELKLDVARPAGKEGLFPAVLLIHGGAWRAGNKSDVRPIAGEFTKRGYVAVAPAVSVLPQGSVSRAGSRCEGGRALDQDQREEVSGRPRSHRGDRLFGGGAPGPHAGPDGPERWTRRGRVRRVRRTAG